MSGAKETPRQKMIGMMYLVLTAMLALNVSSELLKSFLVVNQAMEETNVNFKKKVDSLYTMFQNAYMGNPAKTEEAWGNAQKVQSKTKELYDYLAEVKIKLIAVCEHVSPEEAKKIKAEDIKRQDNYDDPTRFFIGESQDGSAGEAKVIKEKLDNYVKEVRTVLGKDADKVSLASLSTDGKYLDADNKQVSWAVAQFYHTIVVADLAIVNRLMAEVLNAEFGVVSQLFASVSDNDFKFDNIAARAIAKSNYVLVGDQFEAEVFVAAFDSKSEISATIGGTTYKGDSGVVRFKRAATAIGEQKISGIISVPAAFGIKEYPFSMSYIVAEPTATVSADAMNVLYVGVDNPISAMAGGIADKNTKVTMSNGTLIKNGAGKYTARVSHPGAKAVISVYSLSGNKEQFMGSQTYRVKRVPDPTARINGQEEGVKNIDKNTLANAGGLLVNMKDFEFELSLKIGSFAMQISKGQELTPAMRSDGNKFTDDMVQNLKRCKRGDKVFIQDISASMPDGNRTLGDMILTIK